MTEPESGQTLGADVSAIGELLQKLAVEGRRSLTAQLEEELGRLAARPSIRALPKLAAMLDSLMAAIRIQISTEGTSMLAPVMEQLLDCYYSCRAVKTALQGKFNDQPALEVLFGEQRPDRRMETLRGQNLVEVGWEAETLTADRYRESSFLLDLGTGEILVEQLTRTATALAPSRAKQSWKGVVTADSARVHPGFTPRRIELTGTIQRPLERADLDTVAGFARTTMESLHKEYRNFRSNFFAPEEWPSLIAPKGFYAEDERIYLVDRGGTLLLLGKTPDCTYLEDGLLTALASSLTGVLFGVFSTRSPLAGQSMLLVRGVLGWGESGLTRWPRC